MELYRENFRNLPVPNHKAYGYQILHVALSSGPSPRGVNYNPRVELIAKGYKFYIGLYSEILLLKIRTMATKFSPCKGSYVLNQFPSNVMFGMNGFHLSASGAIQGHHGPLVSSLSERNHYSSKNLLSKIVFNYSRSSPNFVICKRAKFYLCIIVSKIAF